MSVRHAAVSVAYILKRLRIDMETGRAYWLDATKHHRNLVGKEAGGARLHHTGKRYWIIKIDGIPHRRSQLIFAAATGSWPEDQVDHKDGDSLNDRPGNLRPATQMQNAWNHKGRKRKANLPMGIRKLPSGKYQARLAVNKRMNNLGIFATIDDAVSVYRNARNEHFGEFA